MNLSLLHQFSLILNLLINTVYEKIIFGELGSIGCGLNTFTAFSDIIPVSCKGYCVYLG